MSCQYRFRQATFKYGETTVMDIDALCIESGHITGITGPNGSGKTTLLNCLAFLTLPSSGEILFQDKAITAQSLAVLRNRIGYVQQKPYLFRTTVRTNIEMGLRFRGVDIATRRRQTDVVMEQLSIGHLAMRNAHRLSGGEIQKVALARALVLEPEILVLDEPFNHLDSVSTRFFEGLFQDMMKQMPRTIVYTSHDQVAAQLLSDQVFSLLKGRLVPATTTNLYSGKLDHKRRVFDTGNLQIHVPEYPDEIGEHLIVDPASLVVSRETLTSSMRNSFAGRVTTLMEYDQQVQLTIEAGERFVALITRDAMQALDIKLGELVHVSFKSSSVHIF